MNHDIEFTIRGTLQLRRYRNSDILTYDNTMLAQNKEGIQQIHQIKS